jgi:FHS family L-fucose permease-like MFS transporter
MQSTKQQDTARVNTYAPDTEETNVRAMSVATSLFFMWGFLTALNDTLIPHLRLVFDLDYTQSMLVQFAFFPRTSCLPFRQAR